MTVKKKTSNVTLEYSKHRKRNFELIPNCYNDNPPKKVGVYIGGCNVFA